VEPHGQGPHPGARLQPRTARNALALAALDSGSPKTAAGGALLLVADALLALEEFGGLHLPAHEGLVMATYTSAQALLAG
jgi:uncharacterized membrane protein YhhN